MKEIKDLRKKVYVAAGYNTVYFGPGRKEFDPSKPMRPFEEYLQEAAKGTVTQILNPKFDEGVIGSFMSGQFLKQANLPAFLPFIIPDLAGKPCVGVEGACGTGGRAITTAVRAILSDLADSVFVAAFEMQNTLKPVYGADVLAGAGYYHHQRKNGFAHFFPGLFASRAGAYFKKYGEEDARRAMAFWYEQSILNARKNPKAQEYGNNSENLFELAMSPPDPKRFVPYLNYYNCSKVSDGASSLVILSEEGLKQCGINKEDAIEIIGMGEAEADITQPPQDETILSTTEIAACKAFGQAKIGREDLALLEIHDCFAINALLSFEALGYVPRGQGTQFILDGNTTREGLIPTNLSGGLGGFGHPTGASGVRQMVDLLNQLTNKAENPANLTSPYGMMLSMGGNDKTVSSIIVKR